MYQEYASLTLLRNGRLKWADDESNWTERWFTLSAERKRCDDPVELFWQMVADGLISSLCHVASTDPEVPDDFEKICAIPLPNQAEIWLDMAPPMPGGEFLDKAMLELLWSRLLFWCVSEIRGKSSLDAFLEKRAPKWRHVGRIFFNLAENKLDPNFPFAFLATYSVGLNEKGEPRHVPLGRALKRYADASDRPALLKLLAPIHKASECLTWVREMVEARTIYQSCRWDQYDAYTFLTSAEKLEECGVGMNTPNWWQKHARAHVQATLNSRDSKLGLDSLVDVDLKIVLGDMIVDPSKLEDLLKELKDGLVLIKGQWVEVSAKKLREALSYWEDVAKRAGEGDLTFALGMRLLAGVADGSLKGQDGEALGDIGAWSETWPGAGFTDLLSAARREPAEYGEIPGLQASLRPYQRKGVEWLSFMGRIGLGCCLADDMGLGKTIQILALLLAEPGENPSLLIAPASLLSNWQAEAERFAPSLKLLSLHGKSREELARFAEQGAFTGYDLVLVSYSGCTRMPWLVNHSWKRVIADEAQAIKNPGTHQSRAVRAFHTGAHIALTGTPIENSLNDLWALFDFLNPGLLGTATAFQQLTRDMASSPMRFAPLRRLTAPYILRRMKTDKTVIDSLPDKTEMPLFCHLTEEQARLYVGVTEKLKESLEECSKLHLEKKQRQMVVLQSMMVLKQICNHPEQAQGGMHYDPSHSGKFQVVGELCRSIAERQEKVLIFSQFREIIQPLFNYLGTIFRTRGLLLHGGIAVKERRKIVETFQSPDGPPFLILTLKVGGTGLTLTEANHVIHFDRWWNPAVEDQATDRAYRIGQKKNVLVHKCLTRGTLEEKIDALITEKRELATEVMGDPATQINLTRLSDEEIINLVRFDASQLAEQVA